MMKSTSRTRGRINLEISDELKRRAKAKAAHEGKTLTSVIARLLEDWARGTEPPASSKRLVRRTYDLGITGTLSRGELDAGLR